MKIAIVHDPSINSGQVISISQVFCLGYENKTFDTIQ